jgi:hypothetical protein
MMSEREGYSKENETLRQYRVAFQQLQEANEALKRELEELKLPISELAGIKMPTRYRVNFMYRRPTFYPLEIAVDFLKSP